MMKLETVLLSQKDKYRMISLISGFNTNETIYETDRIKDIENRLVVAKAEGGGKGLDWEFGINRCKLIYI